MKRKQTVIMKQLLHETDKCELCGSRRGLEAHHIIPVSFGGPEDDIDNLIVICVSCHTRLTPKKLLTKKGIEKAKAYDMLSNISLYVYEHLMDIYDCNAFLDVFDDAINLQIMKLKLRDGTISKEEANDIETFPFLIGSSGKKNPLYRMFQQ